ncbi:sulfatase family protein [uncultured Sunxiuqinia sp.]|uniref:sulfatase family protein n=1 Tax=Sunxiuqinia rutila TaxID=1397841 RepID=UPI0026277D97|nr:arylsulfatase [uncultured Sunxiuqinia sp.]
MKEKKNLRILLIVICSCVFLVGYQLLKGNGTETDIEQGVKHPNVVIIYADDLGYGDISAYGVGKLNTPNIDRIATEGIRFGNGYATSATCTPSRYSLLTGQYPWRNAKAQVLSGDAPFLIDTEQPTLPKILKNAGYRTAVVGKWHLGMGDGYVDWNETIKLNPNAIGFDYSYVMAATNDRVPNVYVENGDVVGLDKTDSLKVSYKKNFEGEPTGKANPELLKVMYSHGHDMSINNGISRIGYQKGGKSAQWIDENMADTFLVRAQQFVKQRSDNPFFLFYALHQPHVPRVPHPRFVGTTGMGPRGDVIAEADWCVGEFLKTLEQEGLMENTLIVFSSDNGPVLDDGYLDESAEKVGDHTPAGPLRGGKYSLYDAGTRVPFMVMWKDKIKPGVSDAIISQVDLVASLSKLTGQTVPQTDSEDMLDVLLGHSQKGRESVVIEGLYHRTAFRKGDWILIPAYEGTKKVRWGVDNETGFGYDTQLYNITDDVAQQNDLAKQMPEKVNELMEEFRIILDDN